MHTNKEAQTVKSIEELNALLKAEKELHAKNVAELEEKIKV